MLLVLLAAYAVLAVGVAVAFVPPPAVPAVTDGNGVATMVVGTAGATDWLIPVVGRLSDPVRLVLLSLAGGLQPLLLGALLARAAASDPGRRPAAWLAALKYVCAGLGGALAAWQIWHQAWLAGYGFAVMWRQTGKLLPAAAIGANLPFALIEVTAVGLVLAAPLYWLVRGVQVRSLERATFEAWLQVRRLLLPAVALLAVATVGAVAAAPAIQVWALR